MSIKFDKDGYILAAVTLPDDRIHHFELLHKNGWRWSTWARHTLEEQRRELRYESRYDNGVAADTSRMIYINILDDAAQTRVTKTHTPAHTENTL